MTSAPAQRTLVAMVIGLLGAACATELPTPESSLPESSQASPVGAPSQELTPSVTPVPEGWITVDISGFDIREIAQGAGRVVAVGSERGTQSYWIATSDDGVVWTPAAIPERQDGTTSGIEQLVFGSNGFVAAGGRYDEVTRAAEPFILHSPDGLAWREVAFPGPCAFGSSILSGVWGYVVVAGSCHGEDQIDKRPIRVLKSPDGVNWTSTTDIPEFATEHHVPWRVATDGRRIAALQDETRADDDVWRWTSDDGGVTWRTVVQTDLRLYFINYARDRWFAEGTDKDGNEVLCTSADAKEWACQPSVDGVPPAIATPTGFLSLSYNFQGGVNGGTYSVLATSSDGESWRVEMVHELPNLHFHGEAATSVGVFAWGGTDPDTDPTGFSQSFLLRHYLPIP